MCRTCAVMVLDWNCNHVLQPNTSWSNSYIMLRDRHEEDYSGLAISALFHFYDHDALDDGGVNLGWGVLQDSSTDHASDVRIACTRGAGNHRFWILATTTAPD